MRKMYSLGNKEKSFKLRPRSTRYAALTQTSFAKIYGSEHIEIAE